MVCVPSQNGLVLACLQPHHATFLAASIFSITGTMPEPACEPSQYGCFLLRPQAHHA
jgi:hypothetical protein